MMHYHIEIFCKSRRNSRNSQEIFPYRTETYDVSFVCSFRTSFTTSKTTNPELNHHSYRRKMVYTTHTTYSSRAIKMIIIIIIIIIRRPSRRRHRSFAVFAKHTICRILLRGYVSTLYVQCIRRTERKSHTLIIMTCKHTHTHTHNAPSKYIYGITGMYSTLGEVKRPIRISKSIAYSCARKDRDSCWLELPSRAFNVKYTFRYVVLCSPWRNVQCARKMQFIRATRDMVVRRFLDRDEGPNIYTKGGRSCMYFGLTV